MMIGITVCMISPKHSIHSLSYISAVGFVLDGSAILDRDEVGRTIVGLSLLVMMNGSDVPITFAVPSHRTEKPWRLVCSSCV